MATQCWLNPNNSKVRVYVLDTIAPATSPAPGGNPVVPAGYVRQMSADGYQDTGGIYVNGAPQPNMTRAGVPYYTGVLSPVIGYDPLAGQPFHTKPSYNPKLGIQD